MLSDRHRKHVSFDKMPSLYVVKSKYCDVTMQNARGGGTQYFSEWGTRHKTRGRTEYTWGCHAKSGVPLRET